MCILVTYFIIVLIVGNQYHTVMFSQESGYFFFFLFKYLPTSYRRVEGTCLKQAIIPKMYGILNAYIFNLFLFLSVM